MQKKQKQNSGRRGKYNSYTAEERAVIGKFATENGVMAAKRRFSRQLEANINESTIRRFKEAYLKERTRKREADEDDNVSELPEKKRGRKLLLGDKLDKMVQQYVYMLREKGCTINTTIVISGARGILKSQDRTRLAEFGGPATLSRPWAKSLLKRMNFTRRCGTTKAKVTPEQFIEKKAQFLQEIIDIVTIEEIPPSLIFNWDQTGLNLVPVSNWTMAQKGSQRVEIRGLGDKRQIGVFCGSLVGEFLPIQLIYAGKTCQCHPPFPFPLDWDITNTPNHWSTEETMLSYIENIIVPFVEQIRKDHEMGSDQAALAIFDHFKGQLTPNITEALEKHNIQSVLVPASCTDRLQPLDLSVNKAAKTFLNNEFQHWYADEISKQIDIDDGFEPVDLSLPRMKCIGAQWLVRLHEYLANSPWIIVNGFHAADIPQSIDACRPVFSGITESDTDGDSSSEFDNECSDVDSDS